MRFKSALASSFLFGGIVLADDHPEKHQRRFINSVNKNLNATLPLEWAGTSLSKRDKACPFGTGNYIFAIGSFSAPLAWGWNSGTGVSVAVAIGGITGACPDITTNFWVGVDVFLTGDNISYTGWAAWGTQTKWSTGIDIAPADFIRASLLLHSRTSGSAFLENLSRNQTWNGTSIVDDNSNSQPMPPLCQGSVEWVVTPLATFRDDALPISNFSTVVFLDTMVLTDSRANVTSDEGLIKTLTLGWASWGTRFKLPSNFNITTGDFIQASIQVSSAATSVAKLKNLSNGQQLEWSFDADEPALCQRSAEWVVSACEL